MRRRDRARELLAAEPWDLVLLDEAHHARRKSAGTPQEGGPNALLRLMQGLKDRCKSLLLLTATPMQVAPVEVWDLLYLLGLPPRWAASSESFVRYFQAATGNPSQTELEFLAEMFRDVESALGPVDEDTMAKVLPQIGKLGRERILKALRETGSGIPLKRLSPGERQGALEILRRFSPVRHRMSRHTRGLLRLYHQRGLLKTPIAGREVRDVAVELSASERGLYEAVEDYISNVYNQAAPAKKTAIGFVLTIYRRRLASCFYALRQTLNNHLEQITAGRPDLALDEEDLSQDETGDEVPDADEAAEMTRDGLLVQERQAIVDLLRRIAKPGGADSKARQLQGELEKAFADGYDSAIVFTQYADTMNYLKEYLAQHLSAVPIACYSGSGGQRRDSAGIWTSCTKKEIKRAFKAKTVRLLVCTDAAGEGLNFQFCGCLANYDLPWNPMKVEQRVGRIDRIGQQYAVIRAINLAYKDTVEADVYFSLGQRIKLFEGIVGKLQPILSRLPREFEAVALERKENREAARQRLLAEVDKMTREANEAPFDIDEVAQEALEMPGLPDPALTMADIDRVLNQLDIRPAELDWRPLDPGTYAAHLPGMAEPVRATTSAEVFDDHCESHVLLSPGGEMFDGLVEGMTRADGQPAPAGHVWLVDPKGFRPASEVVVLTAEGQKPAATLGELLAGLQKLGEAGRADTSAWPGAEARSLG
jgi:hypothetical protein